MIYQFGLWTKLQSDIGQHDIANRSSKFHFWSIFQSEFG